MGVRTRTPDQAHPIRRPLGPVSFCHRRTDLFLHTTALSSALTGSHRLSLALTGSFRYWWENTIDIIFIVDVFFNFRTGYVRWREIT